MRTSLPPAKSIIHLCFQDITQPTNLQELDKFFEHQSIRLAQAIMPTKQILLALLACATFAVAQPLTVTVLEDNPLKNDCAGKSAGADCTLVTLVPGKCQDSGVIRKSSSVSYP